MSSWYWIEGQGYLPHSLYEEAHQRTRDRFNIDLAMQGAQYRRGPAPPMDTAESVQADREPDEEKPPTLYQQGLTMGYRRGLEDAARRIVKAEAGRIRRGFNG